MRARWRLWFRAPRVFISYRRNDTGGFARQLFGPLAYVFGQPQIYMDVEESRPGADFWKSLLDRLATSDYVLAVIGPDWLKNDPLADPKDFVRLELERAVELDKTIIPVLVGGASMPTARQLPESLQEFWSRRAFKLDQTEFGEDVAQLLDAVDHRIVKPAIIGSIAATILLAVGAWTRAADPVTLTVSNWVMAIGNFVRPASPHDDVVMVTVDAPSVRALGEPFGSSWRKYHAPLVDVLSERGAKVIVFDILFGGTTEYDDQLIAAVQRAQQRGTRVIVGSLSAPDLPAPFRDVFDAAGILAIGTQCGRVGTTILGVRRRTAEGTVFVPNIAVLSAFDFDKASVEDTSALRLTDQIKSSVSVSLTRQNTADSVPILGGWRETIETATGTEAFDVGEDLVYLRIRFSPRAALWTSPHWISYSKVIDPDSQELPASLAGKIVLVGHATPQDIHDTTLGLVTERRYGVEIHADVISNLLARTSPRTIGEAWTVVLTAIMAGVGWIVRRRGGRAASPVAMTVVIGGLMTIAVVLYATTPFLLNVSLPALAFLTVYLAAGRPTRFAA